MRVRVAIVGVGYWGPNLVRNFFQIEGCDVAYCCDKNKKVLSQISKHFPSIPLTEDVETILADPTVDAVVFATPSNTHMPLTLQAIKRGKHVFVEKPFTLSVKEAEAVIAENKKAKKIIMVGHTYEYHSALDYLKSYIEKGKMGKIFYIYSSRLNLGKVREETNALWNLAPHDISILRYLLSSNPKEVCAFGHAYLNKKHEDVVYIHLKFPKNVIAQVHVSWLDPSKERKLTIVGSKKMVIFDDMDNEAPIRIYDKGFTKKLNDRGDRPYREYSIKLRPGAITLPYIEPSEPLKEECKHFIECIQQSKQPKSDQYNGMEVVRVLEAAQQSLDRKGTWIKL